MYYWLKPLSHASEMTHIANLAGTYFTWSSQPWKRLGKKRGEVFDQSYCMILLGEPVCAASSQMSFLPVDGVTLITSDNKSRWATMLNKKLTMATKSEIGPERTSDTLKRQTDSWLPMWDSN